MLQSKSRKESQCLLLSEVLLVQVSALKEVLTEIAQGLVIMYNEIVTKTMLSHKTVVITQKSTTSLIMKLVKISMMKY